MSHHGTVRERIRRASSFFRELEGVVMTTFNLNATFAEEHALPAALGVEGKTSAARSAELHQRLGITPCTIYYDPTIPPRISGQYRYVALPVPLRGRLFHPKMVIMAGRSKDGTTWVYLAVSSANLSLSGWGRNAESFGETWIHTRHQQSWKALDDFLAWLQRHSPLDEKPTKANATSRIRDVLSRMPNRRRFPDSPGAIWSGSLYTRLYTSVVHRDGLQSFLQEGRQRRASKLQAYSPYWSDVANQVKAFNARETVLVPARRLDGSAVGLSQEQAKELDAHTALRRHPGDNGTRFWHMKAYWISHGDTLLTAVGSCNFTQAGLSGSSGNVEAMLVMHTSPDWLPEGEPLPYEDLATEALPEEEAPAPAPIAIVVAWDWQVRSWRWWLDLGPGQRDVMLHLPGLDAFPIAHGTHAKAGTPPTRGATFTVTYHTNHGQQTWQGQVVELQLDYSTRTYGRPLTASEILESWCGRAPTWDIGGKGSSGETEDGIEEPIQAEAAAAFDAVNLYDLYRSMRALRTKLVGLHAHPDIQRSHLVGRPDSVIALAHLAAQSEEAPVVRYLVLRELCSIITDWAHLLDQDLVAHIQKITADARQHTHNRLQRESRIEQEKADAMLLWFEQQLIQMDQGGLS